MPDSFENLLNEDDSPASLKKELDLVRLTRRGVSKKMLLRLAEYSTFSVNELARLLPVSVRTIQRYDEHKKFKSDVSEHIILIARVLFRGNDVFDSRETLKRWLTTPQVSLGDRTPFSLLDTSFGVQIVLDELGRIEHGVYS